MGKTNKIPISLLYQNQIKIYKDFLKKYMLLGQNKVNKKEIRRERKLKEEIIK